MSRTSISSISLSSDSTGVDTSWSLSLIRVCGMYACVCVGAGGLVCLCDINSEGAPLTRWGPDTPRMPNQSTFMSYSGQRTTQGQELSNDLIL